MPTVLITGTSSGFGLDTAKLFLDRGWNVVATMRTPREDLLPRSDRLTVLPLDITDPDSISRAIAAAGPLDAVVNNAGVGAAVPLELTTMETARALLETNTLGTLAVAQAVLPQMRARGEGVIVNVTSSVTLKPLPLVGFYSATKAAVNALTESLAIEVEPFGVRVRLVLPGRAPSTQFGSNALVLPQAGDQNAYSEFARKVFASLRDSSGPITEGQDVAEAVWRAVTDPAAPMRIAAGKDAEALMPKAG